MTRPKETPKAVNVEENLPKDLVEQTQLADIGELAGQANHKFNNFLNSLLLKITLLETQIPELAGKFGDIRRQARQMAEIIKQVHQSRKAPDFSQIQDLHALIKKFLAGIEGGQVSPRIVLADVPALVAGSAVDYERLISFLLRDKRAGRRQGESLPTMQTAVTGERVYLSVDDPRLDVPSSSAADLFESEIQTLDAYESLRLATIKAIVRRYQGAIQASPGSDRGVMIKIEFPLAKKQK